MKPIRMNFRDKGTQEVVLRWWERVCGARQDYGPTITYQPDRIHEIWDVTMHDHRGSPNMMSTIVDSYGFVMALPNHDHAAFMTTDDPLPDRPKLVGWDDFDWGEE